MASKTTDIEGGKGSLAFPKEQAPEASRFDRSDHNVSAAPTSGKKKKILVGAIAALALVGLVVGLSVGLTRDNNGTQAAPVTTTTSQFTETKAFIDAVCSDDDTTQCSEACEPVDCCNPFAENNCLMENAEKCMEYAMCHVVKEVEARGAPSGLLETCLTDKDECSKQCEDVKCCFDATEKCQDTQFLTCMDYAACQVLNMAGTVDPAPIDLWETCTDPDEQDDCEKECEKASCCWDEDANCLATDFITCMTYAPCGSLLIQMPNTVVDRPSSTFQSTCSVDSVLTDDGYEACEKQCEEASCCSAEGDKNCFQEDMVGCLQHLQCGLLAFAGGSVEKADTEELGKACDLQDILNGGPIDDCLKACEAAECCVAEGDENCFADGNALACASYLPCLPVLVLGDAGLGDIFSGGFPDWGDGFPDFGDGDGEGFPPLFGEGTIDAPPDDLKEKCSPANLNTDEGKAECEDLCEEVKCCTSTGDDNCLLENIVMCATWNLQGCFQLNTFQQT